MATIMSNHRAYAILEKWEVNPAQPREPGRYRWAHGAGADVAYFLRCVGVEVHATLTSFVLHIMLTRLNAFHWAAKEGKYDPYLTSAA